MRVISGKLKGRNILGHNISGTRPTMNRVKESVFAMIQDYLPEAIVLDLFAGSGNLGIEALSNGASKTYFNDKNKKCVSVIQKNLSNFGLLDNNVITNLDCFEALKYYQKEKIIFDLVFLDPPYKEQIIGEILEYLRENNLLKNNSLIICEVGVKELISSDKLTLIKEKNYGDKKILIFKFNDNCVKNVANDTKTI